jgi:hypothetical protein
MMTDRHGASFWRDRNGYMATWRWWLFCLWFGAKAYKQAACRAIWGRSFVRKTR